MIKRGIHHHLHGSIKNVFPDDPLHPDINTSSLHGKGIQRYRVRKSENSLHTLENWQRRSINPDRNSLQISMIDGKCYFPFVILSFKIERHCPVPINTCCFKDRQSVDLNVPPIDTDCCSLKHSCKSTVNRTTVYLSTEVEPGIQCKKGQRIRRNVYILNCENKRLTVWD